MHRYNANTNKINVTDESGWSDIKILDTLKTGIDINYLTTILKLK